MGRKSSHLLDREEYPLRRMYRLARMRYSVCSKADGIRSANHAIMHDLIYFREHLDVFAAMAKRRNITLDLDGFRAPDKARRGLITANEPHRAQRNKASDEMARQKKEKQSADALSAEMK